MDLIREIITIVGLIFFIPISIYLVKKVIPIVKNINFFIGDIILYIEKLIWNKAKLKVKRRK